MDARHATEADCRAYDERHSLAAAHDRHRASDAMLRACKALSELRAVEADRPGSIDPRRWDQFLDAVSATDQRIKERDK